MKKVVSECGTSYDVFKACECWTNERGRLTGEPNLWTVRLSRFFKN